MRRPALLAALVLSGLVTIAVLVAIYRAPAPHPAMVAPAILAVLLARYAWRALRRGGGA